MSRTFGLDRGTPIDRYYIRRFLASNARFIVGKAVEVGGTEYLAQYGGPDVKKTAFIYSGDPHAIDGDTLALKGDFTDSETIPEAFADCLISTQVFSFIFETETALSNARRLLKVGGTLVGTVPGICQISRYDADRWGDFWRFTPQGLERLLMKVFGQNHFSIHPYGNALGACCLIQGAAVEDLPDPALLDEQDPDYPIVIGFIARK